MQLLRYNEPGWKIDVVSEINTYVSNIDIRIKRAGGELTVISGERNLFPDVILFSGPTNLDVLQGWELKFPDTSITDSQYIDNAVKKATYLKLNSFLLWNVTTAVLYIYSESDERFIPYRTWDELSFIRSRHEVEPNRDHWVNLLHRIINELNDFFRDGVIISNPFIEFFSDCNVVENIVGNYIHMSGDLQQYSIADARFDAEVDMWWRSSKLEYPSENNRWKVLSRNILLSWINKLLFAHLTKNLFESARVINDIKKGCSINDAISIFNNISNQCDFWTIFKPKFGDPYVPDYIWEVLLEFNEFLIELRLDSVDQNVLKSILESSVNVTKRKAAGQYTTPSNIAELLVRLTLLNRHDTFYDPCCGTGTIAKAAYKVKIDCGIEEANTINSIWLSDKYSYPLQIASLSLAKPNNIGQIIKIFKKDIIELQIGDEICFKNPNTGHDVLQRFGQIDCVVSNLPFVQQEDLSILNPDIDRINEHICLLTGGRTALDGRSDLYTYIPFYIWDKLSNEGRLGIITSNSWLGTDMGRKFRFILRAFFNVEYIIISNRGRWFSNSDVVTLLTIMKKKQNVSNPENEHINFVSINESIDDCFNVRELADGIITGIQNDSYNVNSYSTENISYYESYGLEWSSYFADISWLIEAESTLCFANDIFDINRGERRGWDRLFFPEDIGAIESQFIKPVLKSSTEISNLIAEPNSIAFCCGLSIEELQDSGLNGALNWIRRFEGEVNNKGKPLPEVLARRNQYWYEMNPSTIADMVALVNYDRRIFIAKMRERAFVNQRLIRFTRKIDANVNIDICFALLNSIVGIFFIEALGFGRGLGALDLNPTKLKRGLRMLNPRLLNPDQIESILNSFNPILDRPILGIDEELLQADRITFDNTVLECFSLMDLKDNIINSFKTLYGIRKAVNG